MKKTILITLLSIYLDGVLYLNISHESYFLPLFFLMSLIITYPDFNDKNKYIIYSIFTGIIYDLLNTSYFILNGLIFLIISNIIYSYFKKIKYNIFSVIFISILCITLYQLILLIIFSMTNYINFSLNDFIYIVPHFYISNLIFILLFYNIKKIVMNKIK